MVIVSCPDPTPTRKRVWWQLSDSLVVPSQQYWMLNIHWIHGYTDLSIGPKSRLVVQHNQESLNCHPILFLVRGGVWAEDCDGTDSLGQMFQPVHPPSQVVMYTWTPVCWQLGSFSANPVSWETPWKYQRMNLIGWILGVWPSSGETPGWVSSLVVGAQCQWRGGSDWGRRPGDGCRVPPQWRGGVGRGETYTYTYDTVLHLTTHTHTLHTHYTQRHRHTHTQKHHMHTSTLLRCHVNIADCWLVGRK